MDPDKGFPTNQLINVFKVRNELLFTAENGVYRYDEKPTLSGLTSCLHRTWRHEQIWYMQEDALGNIYFIGREHIGVFRRSSIGDYTMEANAFNKIRKFLNDDLENITY